MMPPTCLLCLLSVSYTHLVDYAAFSAFGTFELTAEEWEKRDLIVNFKGNSELTKEMDHQEALKKAIEMVSDLSLIHIYIRETDYYSRPSPLSPVPSVLPPCDVPPPCVVSPCLLYTSGVVYPGRPESEVGAHARHYNAQSIGICYEAVSYTHLVAHLRLFLPRQLGQGSSPTHCGWSCR